GADRAERHRQPHHRVAEAGAVVFEEALGRGDHRSRGGQRRQAALEVTGLDITDHSVDAVLPLAVGAPRDAAHRPTGRAPPGSGAHSGLPSYQPPSLLWLQLADLVLEQRGGDGRLARLAAQEGLGELLGLLVLALARQRG